LRRQPVFFAEADDRLYLALLHTASLWWDLHIWAYCLMTNHIHLVAWPEHEHSLTRAVAETHRRYTRAINFREGWRVDWGYSADSPQRVATPSQEGNGALEYRTPSSGLRAYDMAASERVLPGTGWDVRSFQLLTGGMKADLYAKCGADWTWRDGGESLFDRTRSYENCYQRLDWLDANGALFWQLGAHQPDTTLVPDADFYPSKNVETSDAIGF
jgi:hypothetical protein